MKAALGQRPGVPALQLQAFAVGGLRLLAFLEYDVEFVVRDIESLVFWLNALDLNHADVDGQSALAIAQHVGGQVSDPGIPEVARVDAFASGDEAGGSEEKQRPL